jgi:hypothetical protein
LKVGSASTRLRLGSSGVRGLSDAKILRQKTARIKDLGMYVEAAILELNHLISSDICGLMTRQLPQRLHSTRSRDDGILKHTEMLNGNFYLQDMSVWHGVYVCLFCNSFSPRAGI